MTRANMPTLTNKGVKMHFGAVTAKCFIEVGLLVKLSTYISDIVKDSLWNKSSL